MAHLFMKFRALVLNLVLSVFSISTAFADSLPSELSQSDFNNAIWQTLLEKHVKPTPDGGSTTVSYQGMANDRALLVSYLNQLSEVTRSQFDRWRKAKQLAFLINAYNAWTIELILTEYPNLSSIKELGSFFSSPWSKEFIPLLGETVSLDAIEHELIRASGRYNDARIHFAVNCASIGCPALRDEPYIGRRLDEQLEQQTHQFLSDTSRNRVEGDELFLSLIFDWYEEDFEKGWQGFQSLGQFLIAYRESLGLSDEQVELLKRDSMDVDYLDYDWKLNRH